MVWAMLMNNAAYRNALRMLTTGNIFGSMDDPPRDATSWTSMFGDVMRGLTNITFGQKDVLYTNVSNALRDHFGLRRTYYSNDVGNIHYLHMDTSDPNTVPYDASSPQYRFVLADLKAAFANPRINWIMATTNRAPYAARAAPSAHKYTMQFLRDIYHPLFDKYVDIWNCGILCQSPASSHTYNIILLRRPTQSHYKRMRSQITRSRAQRSRTVFYC